MFATIGHNVAPSDLDVVNERLLDKERELRLSISQISPPGLISDEKEAGVATDVLKQIIALANKVSDIHETVKKPYLECGRAVDGWKNRLNAELEEKKLSYTKVLNVFLEERAKVERERQIEQARLERERSERLTEEAQVHAEAGISDTAELLLDAAVNSEVMAERIEEYAFTASPSQLAKTRSSLGSTASQKLVWVGEIANLSAVNLDKLRPHLSLADVQKAVNAFVRNGGRELDGVSITQKKQLSVR